MGTVYHNIAELVGNTPLAALHHFQKQYACGGNLFAKLEFMNPAGSAKDRIALQMIADAEESGILQPGGTLIEPTSGNTGVGLAAIGVQKGYRVILTMPETMSMERRLLLQGYGAEIVLTSGEAGMRGAVEKAEALQKTIPNAVILGQFENSSNAKAHFLTTGPEIWDALNGNVDCIVAGVGTGGTLTGTGRYLKQKNPDLHIVAVEPSDSPLLSKGYAGAHGLQGIGANFIPSVLRQEIIDEMISITTEEAYQQSHALAKTEGFLVGISSGAALAAAVQIAMRETFANKNIVVVLPDGGERYLSTPLFQF